MIQVYAFCDSDWDACPLIRHSLAWKTKKQATVSRSSTEVEYRAIAIATSEMIWIKMFLAYTSIFLDKPMKLFCDNQAAIHIVKNLVFRQRTKHIEIDCHFVQERLLSGDLETGYVLSKYQGANIFTKVLSSWQTTVSVSARQAGHDQPTYSTLKGSIKEINILYLPSVCVCTGLYYIFLVFVFAWDCTISTLS